MSLSTGSSAGALNFVNVAGALGQNNINVDTSNIMNLITNGVNFFNSNGTTTNITTDVYMGNSTATTRRFTLDCIATGGAPYFTTKARNSATTEISLTNSLWSCNRIGVLFKGVNPNAGMFFSRKNGLQQKML